MQKEKNNFIIKQVIYSIPMLMLLFLNSCDKKNICPENVTLGNFTIEEQTLGWNPYLNHSKVVFIDSTGEEFVFKILDIIKEPALQQREIYKNCELDKDVITTYDYTFDYEGSILELEEGNLDITYPGPITIKILPQIYPDNPNDKLVGEFLSISHVVTPYSFSSGNTLEFIVNQRKYPDVENNFVSFLQEYNSNGKTYNDVYTNQEIGFNETIIETPLGDAFFGGIRMYYNREYGIIEMEYYTGQRLYFKEFN